MVSVIIPVYNVEKYLRECLDSIINQTYTDLEIILVDDGSADNSGDICDEYAQKDERIKVIHKENSGQAEARNAGIDIAAGDYIYFMDSDDILNKEAIRLSVEFAEKEKADIVCFNAETKYEDFNDPDYREDLKRKKKYSTACGAQVLKLHLENADFFSCLYMHLFRKEFLDINALKLNKLPICEDELFTSIAYVRAERIADLGETLYVRRLRADSVMSKKSTITHIKSLSKCIDEFISELDKYSPDSIEKVAMTQCVDEHARGITRVFSELNNSEKKLAVPELKELLRKIKKLNYQGNWNVILRLRFPYIFGPLRLFYERYKKKCITKRGV